MTNYIITDRVLLPAAKNWFAENFKTHQFVVFSDKDGVIVYKNIDHTFMLVNVNSKGQFPVRELSLQVRRHINGAALNVICPSMIQFFASKLRGPKAAVGEDPIFNAINTLSNYCVEVREAVSLRVYDVEGQPFQHEYSFATYPDRSRGEELEPHYIDENSVGLLEEKLGLDEKVQSAFSPARIFHTGIAKQIFSGTTPDNIFYIRSDSNETFGGARHGFDRVAYAELMVRFSARDLTDGSASSENEIKRLSGIVGLPEDEIKNAAIHNRKLWDLMKQDLDWKPGFNAEIAVPTKREDAKDDPIKRKVFDSFGHLLLTNFSDILPQIDAAIGSLIYSGMPILARNGVAIALGENGIIEKKKEISENPVGSIFGKLIGRLIGATGQQKEYAA